MKERHYTDHSRPKQHTSPHDHDIDWSKGYPEFGKPINYPDKIPEFKKAQRKEENNMSGKINYNSLDNSLNFTSISDFIDCMNRGGEVNFCWNGKEYCAFAFVEKSPSEPLKKLLCEVGNNDADQWADTSEEMLELYIDENKMKDIITAIKVIARTI